MSPLSLSRKSHPSLPCLDQALVGRDEAWEAWLASRERCEDDEPLEFGDEGDYPGDPVELAEIIAEARQASADQVAAEAHIAASGQIAALAAGASAAMGRRGPGMPGSAEPLAGEYSGPGGAFATGQALDVTPGGPDRLKQHPKWTVDQLPDGTFRWTSPSGRQYTTEPTRYPT